MVYVALPTTLDDDDKFGEDGGRDRVEDGFDGSEEICWGFL